MTTLEECIRFWESLQKNNRFVLAISTIGYIEATIKFLEDLQRLQGK